MQKEINDRNTFSEIIMVMFLANGEKIDFFKRASRKIHQRSHRFYTWNRNVIVWRNFVEKMENNRNTFSEIIMDMFLANGGKNQLFQESFQKNPPEFTPILNLESNRHCVEKLCAKDEK
jgi:hypothetical protein